MVTDRRRGTRVEEGTVKFGDFPDILGATFTVAAENAGAGTINVAIQVNDGLGNALTSPVALPWYFANDSAGLTPTTTAHDGGSAIGTDGALIESVANLSGILVTEADGDADITITDAGAFTVYLVLVMPTGELAISGAITHAA